jgi:GNAT superfamily N-acetyltransferase
LILKAYSSRYNLEIKNLIEDFDKEIFEYDDGNKKFTFYGAFNLYINRKIATSVSGIFFDENKIINEYKNIVDIADIIDADVYDAIKTLYNSRIYKQEIFDDKIFSSLFTCYIQRVYVYPEFRKRGIARYIFKNLDKIFLHCFNTEIHCLVIIPKPQQPNKKEKYEEWVNTPDENGVMLNLMIKLLKIEGYKNIGKTNVYVKNYASYESFNSKNN